MRGSHESGYHDLIDHGRREIYQREAQLRPCVD
jgi:hypothetical protein